MKKFHVSHFSFSFEQSIDSFDIESPIDIPTIDSLETLWEWMKHWKSDIPFAAVGYFHKLPDSDDYEYAMYQIISSTYATYNGSEPVRTFCTVKNISAINDAIRTYRQHKNEYSSTDLIIIPSAGTYPGASILIEPTKIIDVPFSEVEQQIIEKP